MSFNKHFKKYLALTLALGLLGGPMSAAAVWNGTAQAQQTQSGPPNGLSEPQPPAELQLEDQPSSPSSGLQLPPVVQPLSQEDELHLNTIGAFSAGFVLQSYGYIGVLADALSKDVYSPELVREMLGETIKYLRNLDQQLEKYRTADIAAGDRRFIAQIQEIVGLLQGEAEALSAFAKTRDKSDLERFENARRNAWLKIKKTLGMS